MAFDEYVRPPVNPGIEGIVIVDHDEAPQIILSSQI
jgi:hypothetical protein